MEVCKYCGLPLGLINGDWRHIIGFNNEGVTEEMGGFHGCEITNNYNPKYRGMMATPITRHELFVNIIKELYE